jgi:hypothetical protein
MVEHNLINVIGPFLATTSSKQSRLPASLRRLRAVQAAPTCLVIYGLSVQRSKVAESTFLGSMLVNESSRRARVIFVHN